MLVLAPSSEPKDEAVASLLGNGYGLSRTPACLRLPVVLLAVRPEPVLGVELDVYCHPPPVITARASRFIGGKALSVYLARLMRSNDISD